MQAMIVVPQAFSVRDERELPIVEHLMARMNPQLVVVQAATGVHVDGGPTMTWGLVFLQGRPLANGDVREALRKAGLDLDHHAQIQDSRIWVQGESDGPEGVTGPVK